MLATLLATKLEQTQMFTADGHRIPVTRVVAGPCWVTAIMTGDGYTKVQLAFGTSKNLNKAQAGQLKKTGLELKPRFFREIRLKEVPSDLKLGQELKVGEVFQVGDRIRVTGISKGKGFAGVVKRHQFQGGPRTHGQSDRERAPGSIGMTTTPGRVFKGKRMAGRMGNETVTVRNLKVAGIEADKNILLIQGLVPGPTDGLLVVTKGR